MLQLRAYLYAQYFLFRAWRKLSFLTHTGHSTSYYQICRIVPAAVSLRKTEAPLGQHPGLDRHDQQGKDTYS